MSNESGTHPSIACGDPVKPAAEAWSLEDRRQMMRKVVKWLSDLGTARLENARAIGRTYSPLITQAEVEAELMKYPKEDCAK